MTNLHEKLNRESDHIRLTADEKRAMRAALFGAPSPLSLTPSHSPYALLSRGWVRALAALVLLVGAGTGTAFASQGALPGQPLYAVKTSIVEPVQLALASGPAAKAAVHAQIAAERVAEAEALAQTGSLDATTSAQLAANFEVNARSAAALADEASTTDLAAAVQVKAQLAVSSSVGGAVLAALGARDAADQAHADALAARVLALADEGTGAGAGEVHAASAAKVSTFAAQAPEHEARPMMALAASSTASATASIAPAPEERAAIAVANADGQKAAAELQGKAQDAVAALRAQFATASSTLSASTTVSVQTQLAGIDGLMQDGNQALNDSIYDTATSDFADALGRALRLSALLEAQQKFNIAPLLDQSDQSDNANASLGSTIRGTLGL